MAMGVMVKFVIVTEHVRRDRLCSYFNTMYQKSCMKQNGGPRVHDPLSKRIPCRHSAESERG